MSGRSRPSAPDNGTGGDATGLRWQRLALAGTATAVLLFLAWRVIVETNALSLARVDPEAALAWKARSAPALVALAEQRLVGAAGNDDLSAAGDLAARALTAAPLEGRALTLMGLAADYRGDIKAAETAMNLAGTRSLRDDTVQGWLFNRAVRGGDFAASMAHANALLRTDSPLSAAIFANLAAFAGDAAARPALLAGLATKPPWRDRFLAELGRSSGDPSTTFTLLSDLAATANPPSSGEIKPFLQHLIRNGSFDLAYIVWIHFLPEERRQNLKYVFNGEFDFPNTGLPFDWTLVSIAEANVAIADTGEAGVGRALYVEFKNTRVKHLLAATTTMLPVGRYRLTGIVRGEAIDTERGLVWVVACVDSKATRRLVTSEPLKGTFGWQGFETVFDVPEGCRAQTVALAVSSRAALDQEISGAAWYDRLAIERLSSSEEGG